MLQWPGGRARLLAGSLSGAKGLQYFSYVTCRGARKILFCTRCIACGTSQLPLDAFLYLTKILVIRTLCNCAASTDRRLSTYRQHFQLRSHIDASLFVNKRASAALSNIILFCGQAVLRAFICSRQSWIIAWFMCTSIELIYTEARILALSAIDLSI